MDVGVQEITGPTGLTLGGLLLWQFVRALHRLDTYLEAVKKHQAAVEAKLDLVVLALRGTGVPQVISGDHTPVHDPPQMRDVSGEHRRV